MHWRKLLCFSILVLSFYAAEAQAYLCLPHNKTYITCKEIDAVEGKGGLYLDRTTVIHWLTARGCVNADCSSLGAVSISGSALFHNSCVHGDFCVCGKAKLCHTTIEGTTCMRGILEAYDSTFEECIQIDTSYLELNHSETSAIVVQGYGCSPCDLQIVKINRGSIVHGDIVFESGRGRVLMDRTSCITGTVHGGVITYPGDCSCY